MDYFVSGQILIHEIASDSSLIARGFDIIMKYNKIVSLTKLIAIIIQGMFTPFELFSCNAKSCHLRIKNDQHLSQN